MGVNLNDAFIVLFGYLLGSVNFAIIISKASGNGDVRDYGSGNAGTSNVARTIGLKYGAVVMVLDILKGFIAGMVGKHFVPADGVLLGGFAAILGHRYPIFFKMRGGKSVATYGGVLLAIDYRIAFCFAGAWLFFILITRYMAMGAILGVWIVPLVARHFQPDFTILPTYGIAIGWILVFFHRQNFKRIRQGTELKVSFKLHEKEQKYD